MKTVYLDLAIKLIIDDVDAKFSRLLTIVFVLLGIMGLGIIGLNLITKYWQTQQISQLQKANQLLKQKKYTSAITAYDQLLQSDFAQPDILWSNRGTALLRLERYQEALESCEQATSINRQADLGWNCRGEALYYLDQRDSALVAFQKAIAINSQTATFWLNQNKVLLDLDQHQQAIFASEQGISLLQSQSPTLSEKGYLAIAFKRQGKSWLKLQQNQRALTAFNQSLTYQPQSLSAQQGKGIALYRLGFYSKAIATFNQVLQRHDLTDHQEALNWLYKALSLCETTQAEAATQAFAQVLKRTDNSQLQEIAQAGCGIR